MKDFRVDVGIELKVCEGCGALWLRSRAMSPRKPAGPGVYCRPCAGLLAEFPQRQHSRRGGSRRIVKRRHQTAAVACAGGAR